MKIMKIHYYEYTDDGEDWRKGAASFYSLEILQLAEQQPYEYRIHTVAFDPSRIAKRWNKEKITHNLKEATKMEEIMKVLKSFD
jgi:hypothetical protein